MPSVIVSDASCLILFHKIDELGLLKELFETVHITQIVASEFNRPLPDWIQISNPVTGIHKGLIALLDPGEASSIALALEHSSSLLIIDERKGRKVAKQLQLTVTGSLGILVAAKQKKLLTAISPVLEKIEKTNFRLSDQLKSQVLRQAGESE